MRKTGSRVPRESLEASAVSPFSIAVNTFSIRFGSRRNQRAVHQKIRSITTVSPMIDTMRIGHMIGPPLRKLSINQLVPTRPPLGFCSAAGAGLPAVAGAGLNVAVIVAPGATGPPGGTLCAGSCAGAAGFTVAGAPGLTAVGAPGGLATGGAPGGDVCGGAGDCAGEVSAIASEHRQAVSNVFIVEARIWCVARLRYKFPLIADGASSKTFHLFLVDTSLLEGRI